MITFQTPAKINLFLNILSKQPNSYHQIDSIFVPIHSLNDKITMQQSEQIKITCNNQNLPLDNSNLCWQAIELFNQATNSHELWSIKIDKNIPISAGLGGGSSDAAATLSFLNRFHNYPLDNNSLITLAKKLGADVPFFLNPQPAIVKGIGEKIEPIKLPTCHFIIAFPNFPISAKWAYQNLNLQQCKSPLSSQNILSSINQKMPLHNSLAPAIIEKFTLIELILQAFENIGLQAQINGSGSSIFALCPTTQDSKNIIKKLHQNPTLKTVDLITASYLSNQNLS